jgi:hypothetical protein
MGVEVASVTYWRTFHRAQRAKAISDQAEAHMALD